MKLCFKCKNKAVWCYMPGKGADDDYYCAVHVNRGCSCNEFDGNKYFDRSNGMELPCCEYDYNAEGFDYEEEEYCEEVKAAD